MFEDRYLAGTAGGTGGPLNGWYGATVPARLCLHGPGVEAGWESVRTLTAGFMAEFCARSGATLC